MIREHLADIAGSYETLTSAKDLAQYGHKIANHKGTEGTWFIDGALDKDVIALDAEGFVQGIYHFYRPKADPIEQAHFFHNATSHLPFHYCIIDWERIDGLFPTSRIIGLVIACGREMKRLTGKPVVLYSGMWFLRQFTAAQLQPLVDEFPLLWNASYWWEKSSSYDQVKIMDIVEKHEFVGPGVAPWPKWFKWQWTARGRLPGIDGAVDLNVTQDSFEDFCTALGIDVPTTPGTFLWDVYNFLVSLGYQGQPPEGSDVR